jgi:molybdenum cofactor cytidylyltransferase
MGQPKMLLPWGEHNVIRQVTTTVLGNGVTTPIIVTGRSAEEVRLSLHDLPVRFAHNPAYETTEMLESLQAGMRCLPQEADAFLVVLGDNPQIEGQTIRQICREFFTRDLALIIPSHQYRRGHPWLIRKNLWPELLAMPATDTLRLFLNRHAQDIHYLNVDTPSILMDLDTLDEYHRQKPETGSTNHTD